MQLTDGVDDDRMTRDDTGTWRERGDARRSRNVIVGVSLYTDFSVTTPFSSVLSPLSSDNVGWSFHPQKPVPHVTYNVYSGMLNPFQSISLFSLPLPFVILPSPDLPPSLK